MRVYCIYAFGAVALVLTVAFARSGAVAAWERGRRAGRLRYLVRLISLRRLGTAVRLVVHGDIAGLKERAGWLLKGELARREAEAVRRKVFSLPADPWPPELPLVSVVIVCFNYGAYVE